MPDANDDELLLRKAVAGDSDALEALLLRHFDRLVADVSRRLPEDLRGLVSAEDVVQDAMIVAFQRIGGFESRDPGGFFAWLARIAENRLMDAAKALRAAKRGGGRAPLAEAVRGPDDEIISLLELLPNQARSPSRSAAAHEAVAALQVALELLEPDYRDVLRLRYIEMQTVGACAVRMQRSEGAVHMLLSRALAALRARLGDSAQFFTRKA
jgi:RNA polymerase sigma-70 factor (ECF subfamily)